MQATTEPLSVTAVARRTQIVACATEVIAEIGYQKATYTQIAKRAGLSSTGLISYHFANRRELMEQVVAQVIGAISEHMFRRMRDARSATDALRTYIEGNVEFVAANRPQMTALLAIFLSGELEYDPQADTTATSHVERILLDGQRSGEFRSLDATVVAMAVQRAVEGATFSVQSQPDLDLEGYGRELSTLFLRAVRADVPTTGEAPR